MSAKQLKQFRAYRDIASDRIEEIYQTALEAIDDQSFRTSLRIRCINIDALYEEFNSQHNSIIQIISAQDDANLEPEQIFRQEVDKRYYKIKGIHFDIFESHTLGSTSTPQKFSNVKLPKINVPVFNGNLKAWPTFISLYDSLIHSQESLTDVEKFQYLLSVLTGDALSPVKNIMISGNNYQIAYDNLVSRFQNKRLLANCYWEEISNAPKITSDSPRLLRQLLDTFSDNLKALENLSFPVKSWDFILFHALSKKLDSESLKRFELEHASTEVPTYTALQDFLNKQCVAFNSLGFSKQKSVNFPHNKKLPIFHQPTSSQSSSSLMTNTNILKCPLCQSLHTIYKCPSFLSKSPKERYDLIKQKNWCLNCLGNKHTARNCSSQNCCRVCNVSTHHTLLHFNNPPPLSQSFTQVETTFPNGSSENTSTEVPPPRVSTLTSTLPYSSTVLLSTAEVEAGDVRGTFQKLRVLLDSASQSSFITAKCANRLGLPKSKMSLSIHGLGDMSSVATDSITCTLKPVGLKEPLLTIEAAILPKICSDMPACNFSINEWPHLAKIKLADSHFNTPGPVDMLLGADIFPILLKDGKLIGNVDEPLALNTVFGWVVMGKTKLVASPIHTLITSCDIPLEDTLKRFWSLEEIPQRLHLSPEDIQCENIFLRTHSRDPSGRYIVSLPFKVPDPFFSDTRSQAIRRFHSLERRLLRDPSLYLEYSNCLKDYLENHHMEAVETPSCFNKIYYIPHHCVINPNSTTTRLRVVFDASAKSPQGCSLNDTLLVGQKLQKDIVALLLNFRVHPFVFTADIKQMYRQILIHENQQDYQRILWRFSPTDPIQDFRLKTVTFGVSSAPFLAIRTLHQLAQDECHNFPLAAQVLKDDTYLDDLVVGSPSLDHAKTLQSELIGLLEKGGFYLRKWASNHPVLLQNFPPSNCQQSSLSFDSQDSVIKILGLRWHPTLDYFSYEVSPLDRLCTKRSILSEIARVFDPVGFLSPLLFFAKHLIQHLWSLGLDWDETPPQHIMEKWTQYKNELSQVSLIKIPRHLSGPHISCEIHGFSDSSEKGSAAVVYFRFVNFDDEVKIQLICGKSKVSPLKRISIPRLELCGAVLLSNLMDFVMTSFSGKFSFDRICAWTDSMVALTWIKSSPHRWPTFVSNRVSTIQDKVSPTFWHYIPSEDNPADCASRGLLPSALLNHPLWFSGPPWLKLSPGEWPLSCQPPPLLSVPEEKTISLTSIVTLDALDSLLNKFSSLEKIKRIVVYCLRFIKFLKSPRNKIFTHISQEELHGALLLLVKRVQYLSFHKEISVLEQKGRLPRTFRKLNPFLGEDGVLRVGGRLHHSGLTYDQKHPALLPRDSRLTTLLIESVHRENLHPGLQTTQYLLSQNVWILSPKRAIRHVLSKCLKCFKANPSPLEPFMGNLPPQRVSQLKPFQCVGVDYGGPFNITLGKSRGVKSQKAYLCLFVCFATKAIHLELASDLSSEAFLAALRRFVSRRGRCSRIHSDCGTNFIGASRILSDYMKNAAEQEKISFSFTAPASPHFNGLSEAGIKAVKSHLYRVIGSQILTYEEFYTLLVQIEAILNSRPLCPQSSDPNDLTVLTPGHFLTLEPLSCVPDPDLSHLKLGHPNRWQLVQRFQQDIWKRWNAEYLHTLQQRQKWLKDGQTLEIGDLVVIKNELTPPMQWRMGRVVKTHPGSDGIIRVATIRTNQGLIQRPLVKLCPLPSTSS